MTTPATEPGRYKRRGGDEGTVDPSREASADPAPTRHAPETEGQRVAEKSKYESSQPYKAPKGDRFS